jgi:uncharacterized membrane protein
MGDMAAGSEVGRSETARLEAFSDAVIAIAMTILALDLRVPIIEVVTSKNLSPRCSINGRPTSRSRSASSRS